MISGGDFLMYCAGVGTLMVSCAAAFRLAAGDRHSTARHKASQAQPSPKWEPMPDPASEGLQDRLQAFQAARFSSPIVQRTLDADAGPAIRPVIIPPPMTAPRQMPRPSPRQHPRSSAANDTKSNKVVPIPLKMKKDPPEDDK